MEGNSLGFRPITKEDIAYINSIADYMVSKSRNRTADDTKRSYMRVFPNASNVEVCQVICDKIQSKSTSGGKYKSSTDRCTITFSCREEIDGYVSAKKYDKIKAVGWYGDIDYAITGSRLLLFRIKGEDLIKVVSLQRPGYKAEYSSNYLIDARELNIGMITKCDSYTINNVKDMILESTDKRVKWYMLIIIYAVLLIPLVLVCLAAHASYISIGNVGNFGKIIVVLCLIIALSTIFIIRETRRVKKIKRLFESGEVYVIEGEYVDLITDNTFYDAVGVFVVDAPNIGNMLLIKYTDTVIGHNPLQIGDRVLVIRVGKEAFLVSILDAQGV